MTPPGGPLAGSLRRFTVYCDDDRAGVGVRFPESSTVLLDDAELPPITVESDRDLRDYVRRFHAGSASATVDVWREYEDPEEPDGGSA